MSTEIRINAVAYREGDDWIIQGVEYDIVAFTKDVSELVQKFVQAVVENAIITEHLGREPMEGIKPAPAKFREMFERAQTEMRPTKPNERADVSVRLAEIAA